MKYGFYKQQRDYFPDPSFALDQGIVAVGGELDTELLFEAYSFGIFPWPHDDHPLLWFSPDRRGVITRQSYKVPKSFKKFLRKTNFELRIDTEFEEVIDACSKAKRKEGPGTWITDEMRAAYIQFFKDGYAHSIECWSENQLVGGMYGVYLGGVFSGESMFFLKDNASKFCLYHLLEKMWETGHDFVDIQMVTPATEAFGGTFFPRSEYINRILSSTSRKTEFPRF